MNRINVHIQHLRILYQDILEVSSHMHKLPPPLEMISWDEHARLLDLMITELIRARPSLEHGLAAGLENQESVLSPSVEKKDKTPPSS